MANKSTDEVAVRLKLDKNRQFDRNVKNSGKGVREWGKDVEASSRSARLASSVNDRLARSTRAVGSAAKYSSILVGGVALAGVKTGLQFNAQVETATKRFELFTKTQTEARDLFAQIQTLNKNSTYGLADLADATAYLGNAGIKAKGLPKVMQGVANAASAAGGGADRLQRVAIAIGQISTNGTVSKEDINQLTEAGVNAGAVLRKDFGLTAKQWKNLGNQGINSTAAVNSLVNAWTSGKMSKAAKAQSQTFSGQLDMIKDTTQATLGTLTKPLFTSLEKNVLPAANHAANGINQAFSRTDISLDKKFQLAGHSLRTHMGPVVADFEAGLKAAHLDDRLSDAVTWAVPKIAHAAATGGWQVAEAFGTAFIKADPLGQLLIGGYLLKKLGAGGALKKGLGGLLAGKKGGGVTDLLTGRGSTPMNPLFVAVVNDLPGAGGKGTVLDDILGKKGGKTAKEAGWLKRVARKLPLGGAAGGAARIAGSTAGVVAAGAGSFILGSGLVGGPFGSSAGDDPATEKAKLEQYRRRGMAGVTPTSDDWLMHLPALTGKPQTENVFKSGFAQDVTLVTNLQVDGKTFATVINRHNLNKARGR